MPTPDLERRARAAALFNSDPARRRVAGLMRSLGEPAVSVLAGESRPQQFAVTVAWELSWYAWEVDVQLSSVREIARGTEPGEIPAAAQVWNATIEPDGAIRVAQPAESAG